MHREFTSSDTADPEDHPFQLDLYPLDPWGANQLMAVVEEPYSGIARALIGPVAFGGSPKLPGAPRCAAWLSQRTGHLPPQVSCRGPSSRILLGSFGARCWKTSPSRKCKSSRRLTLGCPAPLPTASRVCHPRWRGSQSHNTGIPCTPPSGLFLKWRSVD
jgi:hypothetical protein